MTTSETRSVMIKEINLRYPHHLAWLSHLISRITSYVCLQQKSPTDIMAHLPAKVPMGMAIQAVTAIITDIYHQKAKTNGQKVTDDLVITREELRKALGEAYLLLDRDIANSTSATQVSTSRDSDPSPAAATSADKVSATVK